MKEIFFTFREVLAQEGILNMPGKADWRSVVYTKEEEEGIAETFREKFKEFDFT